MQPARVVLGPQADRSIFAGTMVDLTWPQVEDDVQKYAGTFSVRPETMRALLADVFASLASWGFTRAFVINAHGDPTHRAIITQAIQGLGPSPRLRAVLAAPAAP